MRNRAWCGLFCGGFTVAYLAQFLLEGNDTALLIGNIFLATCFIINAGEKDNE
jgi:hypothetical protein